MDGFFCSWIESPVWVIFGISLTGWAPRRGITAVAMQARIMSIPVRRSPMRSLEVSFLLIVNAKVVKFCKIRKFFITLQRSKRAENARMVKW